MKFQKHRQPEPGALQIAPMIDVVFLLLIFFIVTWSYARFETELDIAVPAADEGKDPKRTPGEIVINVRQDGRILVHGSEIDETQLLGKLKTIAKISKDQAIILRGDGAATYHDIIRVLNICHKAKIWNVAFATSRPEEK